MTRLQWGGISENLEMMKTWFPIELRRTFESMYNREEENALPLENGL